MLGFLFFCPFLCCVPMLQISCSENTTVLQLSVPEDHRLCLWCGGSDTSDVVWTHQDRTVLVTRQKNYETNQDRTRFQLKPDASLCLLRLDDADAGTFRCNDRLVTELEVLTGQDFRVSAGRTLLLPCRRSDKPKQRWFQRREGGKREPILTRFKNATVKPERHDPRLSYQHDALQILQLQPGDAGEYLCNGELEATVVVLTQSLSVPTAPPAVTGAVTVEKTKTDKTPETVSVLVLVAVVSSAGLLLIGGVTCIVLSSLKCRRKKKHRPTGGRRRGDAELQLWTSSSTAQGERHVEAINSGGRSLRRRGRRVGCSAPAERDPPLRLTGPTQLEGASGQNRAGSAAAQCDLLVCAY
ncbi:uncharacterized protein LOC143013861 isoform X1 [Genypterus blacodes]|uniref:uncharacterized protein LOC143013861 isoform X1 n=1 Tax=Genypterus blacodes TaxID=154954 RepID=UPI003F7603D7